MEEKKSGLTSLMGGDHWLWGVYTILVFISIVELFSASSRLAYRELTNDNPLMRHTTFLAVGFFIFGLGLQSLTRANIKWVKLFGLGCYIGGVVLMILMPFFGRRINGAVRDIWGVQPIELCKLGLIIVLCMAISATNSDYHQWSWFRRKTELRRYILLLFLIALVAGLIVLQNLSSALIIGFTALGIMFVGEVKGKYLLRTIITIAVMSGLFIGVLFGLHTFNRSQEEGGGAHHTDLGAFSRANVWEQRIFDGSSVPLWEQKINDDNMQVMYAHMAIANSNVIGRFVGESQLRDHLPEAYSDYIYAIIFEELGVEGAALVMLLYFILMWRCYRVSKKTKDPFKRLIMIGIPLMLLIQALIHIGVCTDAMFVTGQPLPLISRGGMGILSTSACFGILFGVSHTILREEKSRLTIEKPDNLEG